MAKNSDAAVSAETAILESIAKALGLASNELVLDGNFRDQGVDSARVVSMLAQLGRALDRRLPVTLVWEHPTPRALATYLVAPRSARSGGETYAEADTGANDPIALVGIACRMPGARSVAEYWRVLRDGVDAITEAPTGREAATDLGKVDGAPEKGFPAGFLEQVDRFDASFFGISGREAEHMDPQQRLSLEVCWEALEDAKIPPARLAGTRSGVFFGAIWREYADVWTTRWEEASAYSGTGGALGVIANRISYVLDLRGPSIVVDTACSSSLVAVHLACQSLRNGESDLCLVGGVNLLLSPVTTAMIAQLGALSPDGRARAFAESANGTARGEGVAVIVLKRLSRALADGDRIVCTIRGSAVNQDGRSNGLTAPNPRAQVDVLRAACRTARVEPSRVHYVEAHGTGTPLGDPIEAHALGAVFGEGRSETRPLRIGSVKTNVGHLEGAAGIAGLIKVALAMDQGVLPPSLHVAEPNHRIDFAALRLQVQSTLGPWPARSERPLAGVSSFGWGGTNCHVIVQGWSRPSRVVVAASPNIEHLRAHVEKLRDRVAAAQTSAELDAICRACVRQLQDDGHRVAFAGSDPETIVAGMDRFLENASSRVVSERPRVAFVYSPQGGQWEGMGADLLRTQPVFRRAVEACDASLRPLLGWSVIDALVAPPRGLRWDATAEVQPLIFTIQVGLTALWRDWGIVPDAVIGHSVGEIAAAYAAGILELADACRVVAHYGRAQERTARGCGMAVIGLPADDVEGLVGSGRLVVSGYNSPRSTNVSGPVEDLDRLVEDVQRRGEFAVRIRIDAAVHSSLMEPILEELRTAVAGTQVHTPTCTFVSTVSGAPVSDLLDDGYWSRNLRDPVRFREGVQSLNDLGCTHFVELGPHPVHKRSVEECLNLVDRDVRVFASMERGDDDGATVTRSLTALYEAGAPVSWANVLGVRAVPLVRTPLPFVVSGKTENALRAVAERLGTYLDGNPELALVDVAFSLATTRSHFEHRAVVVAREREELREAVDALAKGAPSSSTVRGEAAPSGKVVFVFPGQGSQWRGMARALLGSSPVFRRQLEACERAFAPYVDWSLIEVLDKREDDSWLERIDIIQPALFAMMVSLAALWRSQGVEPHAVVGHSQGEIAAAFVAGALSLEDAAKVVTLRSRALTRLSGRGAMLAVQLGMDDLRPYLDGSGESLAVAAVNSPHSTIVSGDPDAIEQLLARFEATQVFARRVRSDVAGHCAHIEAVRDELLEQLAGITPRAPTLPIYSTVTLHEVDGTELDAAYWYRNLRQTVLFAEAIERLSSEGHRFFVEVSPHPVLTLALRDTLDNARGAHPAVVGTLSREEGTLDRFFLSLAALHVQGLAVDWETFFDPLGARRLELPTYPFQRERFWIDVPPHNRFDWVAAGVSRAEGNKTSVADDERRQLRSEPTTSSPPTSADAILESIRTEIRKATNIDVGLVSPQSTFADLGLGSLDVVGIIRAIQKNYAIRVNVKDYQKMDRVGDLVTIVLREVGSSTDADAGSAAHQEFPNHRPEPARKDPCSSNWPHRAADYEQLKEANRFYLRKILGGDRMQLLARVLAPLDQRVIERYAENAIQFDEDLETHGIRAAARRWASLFTRDLVVMGSEHMPASGPVAVVANHPGSFDHEAVLAATGRQDMKVIVADVPYFRILRNYGRRHAIYVSDEAGMRREAVAASAQHLGEGHALMFCPTGNIEPDPSLRSCSKHELGEWSGTLDRLARWVPELRVVPVAVVGVLHPAVDNAFLKRALALRTVKERENLAVAMRLFLPALKTPRVVVNVGAPLSGSDASTGTSDLTRRARERLLQLIGEATARHQGLVV